MAKKINKYIYWIPRIASILLILFLVVFSFDVFESGLTGGQIFIDFFMHNLPSLILAIILWISWKYEIVGGIVFIAAGIAHIIFLAARSGFEPWLLNWLTIDTPAFIIGTLFIIGWNQKKRTK